MLAQLNVSVEKKLIDRLDALKEKTKVSKKALVEQALQLLSEKYDQANKYYDAGYVTDNFLKVADSVMDRYDATMKKLAE